MRQGDEVAGRYRLDELQGHGPMSEVWRADDLTLDRTVALKILSPTADLSRFRREAQAVAALAHENVMRVYDYGEDAAGPFMALEWLPGGTLEDRLSHGALPPGETHRVAEGIAAGLAHLHDRGLVHRDLKPANVLFDEEDRPKLGDFGLVRHTAGSGTLTEAGTVLGTAAYISPEQAAGEPAGAASDVYSFGVILFRMLTGALPFTADSALALVDMHRHAPPPAVEALQPNAPPALAALTASTLRKDPAERPADGAALCAALGGAVPSAYAAAADTQATRVLPAPATPPAGRSSRARLALAGAVVLLAAGGAALAWGVTRTGTTAPEKSPTGKAVTGTHSATRAPTTQAAGTTGGRVTATGDHTTSSRQTTATTARSTTAPTTTRRTTTTTPTTAPTTTLGTTTTTPTTTPPATTSGAGTTTAATGTT
ncbi:MAG TPA: serine/threonine-protein kinase [Gaiellaceae bacterium]|nr:serine/threonine-protein kinase [Gaiellaceae bacterium]